MSPVGAEPAEFYFVPSSVRKSVWTFVRQQRSAFEHVRVMQQPIEQSRHVGGVAEAACPSRRTWPSSPGTFYFDDGRIAEDVTLDDRRRIVGEKQRSSSLGLSRETYNGRDERIFSPARTEASNVLRKTIHHEKPAADII
jgi:hypothetical protein